MSYQAPRSFNTLTYIVTSLDLLNAIVIDVPSTNFFFTQGDTDALYNGSVQFEGENQDGTFNQADSLVSGALARDWVLNHNSFSRGGWPTGVGSTRTKQPFHIRARITTKATLGTATLRIFYL